jgi:hypothetical protein
MGIPLKFTPDINAGTHNNTVLHSGTTVRIADVEKKYDKLGGVYVAPPSGNFISMSIDPIPPYVRVGSCAEKFTITKEAYLSSFSMFIALFKTTVPSLIAEFRLSIWTDSLGSPGTKLTYWDRDEIVPSGTGFKQFTLSFPTLATYVLSPGTYWYSLTLKNGSSSMYYAAPYIVPNTYSGNGFATTHPDPKFASVSESSWSVMSNYYNPPYFQAGMYMQALINITTNTTSSTGTWTSTIYDSKAKYSGIPTLHQTVYNDAPQAVSRTRTVTTIIEASDSSSFDLLEDPSPLSQTLVDANEFTYLSLSGKRYWRIKEILYTSNKKYDPNDTYNPETILSATPIFYNLYLKFPTVGEWISDKINCTSDVTSYNSLDVISETPTDTSVVITVASSTDGITYPDGYVSFGSVIMRKYLKIKATLNGKSDGTVTPWISSIAFKWTVVGNFVSSVINTGITPPGWDIFQVESSGSAVIKMRSSATSLPLQPPITEPPNFYTVTNGDFPPVTIPPLQYTQWRVTLTSTADSVSYVSFVVINWFIVNISSIRVASIFYDKDYYLSAAESTSEINNIVIVLDRNNRWRLYKDIDINTFSFFYNDPYFGSAAEGTVLRFLDSSTDNGTNIEMDLRTKAFDFSTEDVENQEFVKILEKVYVKLLGTGASFQAYYSVDEGVSFLPLYDQIGNTTWTFPNDNKLHYQRLRPNYTSSIPIGRTLMLQLVNNDENRVSVDEFKLYAFIRQGEPING